jgi:hypothetical protein
MSNDIEKFLIDFQDLLDIPATKNNKRWKKFVKLVLLQIDDTLYTNWYN